MQSLSVGTDYRSTIGSNSWFKNLERFLGCKMILDFSCNQLNQNLASPLY